MTLDSTSPGALSDKDIKDLSRPLEISFDRPVNPSVALCVEMTGPAGQATLNQIPHKEMALTFITEFGGKISGAGAHSIYAYFHNSSDAIKAAVKIQQQFYSLSTKKPGQNQLQVRIGIHFGEAAINTGRTEDLIGLATKLAGAARAQQIFVSRSVWEAARDLIQVRFELTGAKHIANTPSNFSIYNVIWDKTPETKPATGVVLYLRPLWGLGDAAFPTLWAETVRDVGPFSDQAIKKNIVLMDNTICLILWDVKATVPVIHRILGFLREKLGQSTDESFLPVHVFVRTCSLADENSLAGINVEPAF